MIEAGADVNAKGLDNDTPLHDACINNHFKVIHKAGLENVKSITKDHVSLGPFTVLP